MIAASTLRLVLVTPETTLLDVDVETLRFPLGDGLIGILPNRAPMVGRLGCGELNIVIEGETKRYFIDGGFSQIKGKTVSILTNRAIPASELTVKIAQEAVAKAEALPKEGAIQTETRSRELERAQKMLAMVNDRSTSNH